MTNVTEKLARWQLRLSQFEFEVIHRANIKHQVAEPLSRLPTIEEDESTVQDDVHVLTLTDARYENENAETDLHNHQDLLWDTGANEIRPGISEILQVAD